MHSCTFTTGNDSSYDASVGSLRHRPLVNLYLAVQSSKHLELTAIRFLQLLLIHLGSALVCNSADHDTGRIGRIFDGVFHADGGADDVEFDDNDGWIDLGPDDPSEKERVLKSKIQEAEDKGMYHAGCKNLANLLRKYGDVINLKLDAGLPC